LLKNLPKASTRPFSVITNVSPLTAISPVDGRYAKQCNPLRAYFSEYALIRYRVFVEIQWFKTLFREQIVTQDPAKVALVKAQEDFMDKIFTDFSIENGERVKEIERTTNHDVKAVEYFLKEQFDLNQHGLGDLKEYLHFSCTSEDINNLAYALMLHHSFADVILPAFKDLEQTLTLKACELAEVPMLCRTHG